MNYGAIKKNDIANGPGVRVSLFVSGCRHHCKNCFNPETWRFDYGNNVTQEIIDEILLALKPDWISGLSILGGEPLEPENQEGIYQITSIVKKNYPNKDIWLWTGCILTNDIMLDSNYNTVLTNDLFKNIDYIVDGPFIEERKDLRLKFRGSSNQRIIDMKESIKNNYIVDVSKNC